MSPVRSQVGNSVTEAFNSFRQLLKLFGAAIELEVKPKPPKYRKAGLFTASYPKRWLRLTEQGIKVPLGRQVKARFGKRKVLHSHAIELGLGGDKRGSHSPKKWLFLCRVCLLD